MKKLMLLCLVLFTPAILGAKQVTIGYGYSTKEDISAAVKEAWYRLPEGVKSKPDFCVVFTTVGYDTRAVLNNLREFTGDRTKIYGETSCLGVITPEGVHIGKKGAIAILVMKSHRITFGVGGATASGKISGFDAGKLAIKRAIKNAGKKSKKPKIILIAATPGIEEEVLKGIESVVGSDIPIIGGSAADNEIKGEWKIIANNNVYSKGVALTVIYTDLKVGYSFVSGYASMTQKGIVTKAKGRTIYEIDNRPAGEVYNEWVGGIFSKEMKTGASILGPAALTPLARKIVEKGQVKFLTVHPARINPKDKSLNVFAEINPNDTLFLLRGNKTILLTRPLSVGLGAVYKGGLKTDELAGGIFIYCAGSMLAVKDKFGGVAIPPLVKMLNNKPFIGAFTFGEQGFYEGVGNKHGNLMTSMVVFGEK